MRGMLASDFQRLFLSPKFIGSVIGTALTYLCNAACFERSAFQNYSELLDGSAAPFFQLVLLVFAALPFATAFCEDWENRYIRAILIRTSTSKYAASKCIVCFVGALCTGILGTLLMMLLAMPFLEDIGFGNGGNFIALATMYPTGINGILVHGSWALWLFATSAIRAFTGCIYAMLALCVSTKITNVFVTLAMPVIGYAIYQNISGILQFPTFLYETYFSQNINFDLPNTVISLGIMLAVWVLFFAIFSIAVRRKLENE